MSKIDLVVRKLPSLIVIYTVPITILEETVHLSIADTEKISFIHSGNATKYLIKILGSDIVNRGYITKEDKLYRRFINYDSYNPYIIGYPYFGFKVIYSYYKLTISGNISYKSLKLRKDEIKNLSITVNNSDRFFTVLDSFPNGKLEVDVNHFLTRIGKAAIRVKYVEDVNPFMGSLQYSTSICKSIIDSLSWLKSTH